VVEWEELLQQHFSSQLVAPFVLTGIDSRFFVARRKESFLCEMRLTIRMTLDVGMRKNHSSRRVWRKSFGENRLRNRRNRGSIAICKDAIRNSPRMAVLGRDSFPNPEFFTWADVIRLRAEGSYGTGGAFLRIRATYRA
jgi:hypothetical protein